MTKNIEINGFVYGHVKKQNSESGSNMTCIEQEPTLNYYIYYPGLVLVADDYCKDI